jgi:hypothetical protein
VARRKSRFSNVLGQVEVRRRCKSGAFPLIPAAPLKGEENHTVSPGEKIV